MKQYINKFLISGAVAFVAVACTGNFEEINTNKYIPYDLSADGYLLNSALNNMFGRVIPSDVNMTQFVECLMGGTVGGYMADGNNNFKANTIVGGYAPNGWTRVFLEGNNNSIIPVTYTNLAAILNDGIRNNTYGPSGMAMVTKVAAMHRVTDCYGPVPYSQIGSDGEILTPYDSQEEVYNAMFADLEIARNYLNQAIAANEYINPTFDQIYGGDFKKWIVLANSLQLRLAIHISYVNPALAKEKAEAAVDPVNGGVMESVDQTAKYNHFTSGGNPIFNATVGYGNDSRPAADIICYMNGYNDPRRSVFFTESKWKSANDEWLVNNDGVSAQYCGIRRSRNEYDRDGSEKSMSAIPNIMNSPVLWLNAAEVAFNRAEGVAVFGWNMGGTAESFYNRGIELSFADCGMSNLAYDYINDDSSVPARYYDPSGLNPWNGSLPSVTIKWDDAADTETKQEKIIVQKWIANCYLGNEAWVDIRRTGYPKLIPIQYFNSAVVSAEVGPQRMPYPQEEYTNNSANVQAAVANYLNGPDNMATKVWWACKPGL